MSNVFEAWLAGRTVRKHTMHVHRRENVAEHTWGVVMLLFKYVPKPSLELVRAAVMHDMGEQATCDIPAHLCWSNPALKDVVQSLEDSHVASVMSGPLPAAAHASTLTDDEALALEVADRVEFTLSCHYEKLMGNSLVERGIKRAMEKALETLAKMQPGTELQAAMHSLVTDVMRVTQSREKLA